MRKSKSAKLIDLENSSIQETPFSKPSIIKEISGYNVAARNLDLRDFSKNPPQTTKNDPSKSHAFGGEKPPSISSGAFKEKKENFGNINKNITKSILDQMNTKV